MLQHLFVPYYIRGYNYALVPASTTYNKLHNDAGFEHYLRVHRHGWSIQMAK